MLDTHLHLVEGVVILLASRKVFVCDFYLALYVFTSYLWYTYLSVINRWFPVLTGDPIAKSLPQPMTNDINAATFISNKHQFKSRGVIFSRNIMSLLT